MVDGGNVGVMVLKMLSALFFGFALLRAIARPGVWVPFRVVLTTFTGHALVEGTSREWRGAGRSPPAAGGGVGGLLPRPRVGQELARARAPSAAGGRGGGQA